MRKGLLLALVLAVSTAPAWALGPKFGIKAGVNMANVNGSDVKDTSTLTGFTGGLFLGIPAGTLSIQPELLFSMDGTKLGDAKENLNYMEIPVLVKYNFPSTKATPYLFVGPVIGVLMSAKATAGGVSEDVKDQFKSSDFAGTVGAGLDVGKLSFDARYNFGLTKITKNGSDVKTGAFRVMVGYSFL